MSILPQNDSVLNLGQTRFQTCAMVGTSAKLLDRDLGELIDFHDVRFLFVSCVCHFLSFQKEKKGVREFKALCVCMCIHRLSCELAIHQQKGLRNMLARERRFGLSTSPLSRLCYGPAPWKYGRDFFSPVARQRMSSGDIYIYIMQLSCFRIFRPSVFTRRS